MAIDRKIVKIKKRLARTIQWVKKAISTDAFNRPMLTMLHVEPRKGKYGNGVVYGVDGFRLHIVKDVNTGEVSGSPVLYEDALDLEEGTYEIGADIMVRDHINEFVKHDIEEPNMRDIKDVIPSINKELKPVAIISINPRYLVDAVQNSKKMGPVFIRVFAKRDEVEKGQLISTTPIEVISTEVAEKGKQGKERMAVIMPMHARDSYALEEWPVAFEGWPEEETDERIDAEDGGGDLEAE